MIFLALLTYRVPIAEVERHTPDHRAYMRMLHDAGKLVASGPLVPRTGGVLLYRVASREEVDAIVAADPFFENGVAEYDVRQWAPTVGSELLGEGTSPPG